MTDLGQKRKKDSTGKKFESHEMGMVSPFGTIAKCIILYEDFLRRELGLASLSNRILKKVFCPFCCKGYVRLKTIEFIYPLKTSNHGQCKPAGANYEFDCSENCGARFFAQSELK